jgi:hypothetical protein
VKFSEELTRNPITSQQDQSAKKKPKKSNNENEGDVSTILQESDGSGTIKILNISMMYLYIEPYM